MAMPLNKWGEDFNEDFCLDNGNPDLADITDSFTEDSTKVAYSGNSKEVSLYFEYTKGSEAQADIEVEVSVPGDDENFFPHETTPSITLTSSGKSKVTLPKVMQEAFIRVKAKTTGAPNASTILKIFYGTNNPIPTVNFQSTPLVPRNGVFSSF
jgi:hypothetical protein